MRGRTPVVRRCTVNSMGYFTLRPYHLVSHLFQFFFTRTVVVRHIVRVVPRAAPRTRTGPSHPVFACVGKQPNLGGGGRWGRLHFCVSLESSSTNGGTVRPVLALQGGSSFKLQTSNIRSNPFPCAVTCNLWVGREPSRPPRPLAKRCVIVPPFESVGRWSGAHHSLTSYTA